LYIASNVVVSRVRPSNKFVCYNATRDGALTLGSISFDTKNFAPTNTIAFQNEVVPLRQRWIAIGMGSTRSNQIVTRNASPHRGRYWVLAAAILWSTGGFFAKAPDFLAWSGGSLAFLRAAFACVVLLPMARRIRFSLRLAPMVIAFAAMNYFFLNAMKATEASNAIWLQNTAPIWVLLFNAFVLREPVHRRDWVMLGFGTIGIGLILAFELRSADRIGVVYGVISALTYSGVVISLRTLPDENPFWLIALNHLVTVLVMAPIAIGDNAWPEGRQWILLFLFGVVQMGLPYVLFAQSLKTTPSHEASAITLLEPILTPIWVFLAWHSHPSYQPPQWWTLLGGGLILFGLAARFLRRESPSTDSAKQRR